uniref:Uncharacterized protein n=1 Tax=Romanomermis culicivorax TaxID=13658 RepID=A0A915KMJ3_ROMCU
MLTVAQSGNFVRPLDCFFLLDPRAPEARYPRINAEHHIGHEAANVHGYEEHQRDAEETKRQNTRLGHDFQKNYFSPSRSRAIEKRMITFLWTTLSMH